MKTATFVNEPLAVCVFLTLTALLIVSCIHSGVAQQEGEVVDIGNRNQVFIDGRYMDSTEGCRIVACPPRKTYEQCLSGWLRAYETILPVDGTFRGFHALSKDGIHWRRVDPGTEPEADDLVGLYDGGQFPFADPTAPPEERYKLFSASSVKASADGSEWETVAERMFPGKAYFPYGMDSHNKCFYDTRLDKYVAYVRVNKAYPAPPERREYFAGWAKRLGQEDTYFMRTIGRSVTDDLSSFPMPEVVFEFDENDPHFGGVGVADFYIPAVVQYPHAQDAYYLFNSRYLHYEDWFLADDLTIYPRSGVDTLNTGPIDIGLAASRDGIDWRRYERKPWIPLGPEGSFDSKLMYMCAEMFSHGDEIWMYYVGGDFLHGSARPKSERIPTMSRVVLLKDRFTGVEADYTGGEFSTPALRFDGEALHLNIETSALGLARVEIQDADGIPIEGYTLDDCDRIHTANTVDRVVTWRRGESDVSALAGQPVRLRFELQFGAKLYAFRFGGFERMPSKPIQKFAFRHVGTSNPVGEGWPVVGSGLDGRPVAGDQAGAVDAWMLEDDESVEQLGKSLQYRPALGDDQRDAAIANGWVFRAKLRVADEPNTFDRSVLMEVSLDNNDDLSSRWDLTFTVDEDGNTMVAFVEDGNEVDPKTVTTVPGSGYHLYEMQFDPESRTVNLLVDGEEKVSDYAGRSNQPNLNRISWGAGSSPGTATSLWNMVEFQILPEPAGG